MQIEGPKKSSPAPPVWLRRAMQEIRACIMTHDHNRHGEMVWIGAGSTPENHGLLQWDGANGEFERPCIFRGRMKKVFELGLIEVGDEVVTLNEFWACKPLRLTAAGKAFRYRTSRVRVPGPAKDAGQQAAGGLEGRGAALPTHPVPPPQDPPTGQPPPTEVLPRVVQVAPVKGSSSDSGKKKAREKLPVAKRRILQRIRRLTENEPLEVSKHPDGRGRWGWGGRSPLEEPNRRFLLDRRTMRLLDWAWKGGYLEPIRTSLSPSGEISLITMRPAKKAFEYRFRTRYGYFSDADDFTLDPTAGRAAKGENSRMLPHPDDPSKWVYPLKSGATSFSSWERLAECRRDDMCPHLVSPATNITLIPPMREGDFHCSLYGSATPLQSTGRCTWADFRRLKPVDDWRGHRCPRLARTLYEWAKDYAASNPVEQMNRSIATFVK